MQQNEIDYASISQSGTTVLRNGVETSLHPYQQRAKDEIFKAWNEVDYVMLQMPTGTGKTYLFSSIIHDINDWSAKTHTPNKMLVIAHRRELIEQIDGSLNVFHVAHSVLAGPKEFRNLSNPVVVSSIQTITHKANAGDVERLRERIHFVIIDEAHHAMANTYRKLWKMFPNAKFLGVTATPWRMNHSGFTSIFDRLILTQSVKKFILQGYLSPYNYYSLKPNSWVQNAINGINKFDKWGDYDENALVNTMDIGHIRAQLVASYKKLAWGKKGIIYSINKKHSKNICEDYRRLGVKIVDIDDSTPSALRKQYVEDFKAGKIDIIVNVNIFSEGFDCPDIEFIQLARPTRSLTMYIQQVGRGLRITKGKSKCIILDNVGMYSRFGLPDANRHWMAHFHGQPADEAPKKGFLPKEFDFDYVEPDLSEGNEEMLLIQDNLQESAEESFEFEEQPVKQEAATSPVKTEQEDKPVKTEKESPDVPVYKLKRVSAAKPDAALESNNFHERYAVVADNRYYYVRDKRSGNCYYIAPVFRNPSAGDQINVAPEDDSYIIRHYIPEAEKDQDKVVGRLSFDGDVVTFSYSFGSKTISTSFRTE